MHGDMSYCMKHGHDWHGIDHGRDIEGEPIIWTHVACTRCGVHHIVYSFYEGDDE